MSQSRREFIKHIVGASTVVSLSPTIPKFLQNVAEAAPADSRQADTVLVVVQLSGGNDGLNSIVPYEDDVYGRSRKTLRLTAAEVHKVDDQLGFHPQMSRSRELFQEGLFSVVQGVGYPKSNRDHQAAMRDWYTAQPGDTSCPTGWIGRAVDHINATTAADVPAAFVSPIPRPLVLAAEKSVIPRVATPEAWTFTSPTGDTQTDGQSNAIAARADSENQPLLSFVSKAAETAHATSAQIRSVLDQTSDGTSYPTFPFAQRLRAISQLVQANVGARIYFTELGGGGFGGFDNHANQRDNHAALLRQLSEGVAAFVTDTRKRGVLDRVVLMTFSEFGRTVSENGRRGTGHGAAAPVFLAGGRLKGGLAGEHPDLSDLDQDALKFHTDFRQVYATMLEDWLGFNSEAVLGQPFSKLDLFQPRRV
jgi:uncharacterized protein (DUF1501 family)